MRAAVLVFGIVLVLGGAILNFGPAHYWDDEFDSDGEEITTVADVHEACQDGLDQWFVDMCDEYSSQYNFGLLSIVIGLILVVVGLFTGGIQTPYQINMGLRQPIGDVQTLPGLQANQVSENIGLAFLLNIIFPGAGLIYLKHPQGKKISVSSLFCLLTFFLGITLIALVCLWIYSLSKTPEAYRQLLERNTTSQIHEFSTKQEEIQPNTDASEPPSSKVEDVIAKNKFCTNCGLKLDSSTKFCPDCGTST